LFPQYVVNIEILEEMTFLNTAQGGGLTLDITPGTDSSFIAAGPNPHHFSEVKAHDTGIVLSIGRVGEYPHFFSVSEPQH
jgi:hypothetical protein